MLDPVRMSRLGAELFTAIGELKLAPESVEAHAQMALGLNCAPSAPPNSVGRVAIV